LSQKGTSYGLKHIAVEEIGYITNGVFIAAAIAEGFRVVRIDDSPNALLNISSKVWARRHAGCRLFMRVNEEQANACVHHFPPGHAEKWLPSAAQQLQAANRKGLAEEDRR
jgi:hypothetical protein